MNISCAIDRFILCELQTYIRTVFPQLKNNQWISLSEISISKDFSLKASKRFFEGCEDWSLLKIQNEKIKFLDPFEFNKMEEDFFIWMRAKQNVSFNNNISFEDYLFETKQAISKFNLTETIISSPYVLLFLREIFSRFLYIDSINFVLKNNESPFGQLFSVSNNVAFDQYENLDVLMQIFSSRFAAQWYSDDQIVLKKLNLENLDILDLGGGSGGVALALSEQNIKLNSYSLFDLPSTNKVLNKTRHLFYNKLNEKKEIIYGDFLEEDFGNHNFMTNKAHYFDVLILSWIIHDWPDEKCLKILSNIKKLLKPSGRLIIIERLIDSSRYKMMKFGDFMMLSTVNGLERTLSEYDQLLGKIQMRRISHLTSGNSRDFLVYTL